VSRRGLLRGDEDELPPEITAQQACEQSALGVGDLVTVRRMPEPRPTEDRFDHPARWPVKHALRAGPGVDLALEVDYLEGRRHLPIGSLRRVAPSVELRQGRTLSTPTAPHRNDHQHLVSLGEVDVVCGLA
jgi:hypothetical protein